MREIQDTDPNISVWDSTDILKMEFFGRKKIEMENTHFDTL